MTALSVNRNTKDLGYDPLLHYLQIPIRDNVHIYKGSLVGTDSAGRALPATATTATKIVGRAEDEYDNTIVGHAAGALTVKVKCGIMLWANDTAGNAVTNAYRGSVCYAKDDQTVSISTGGSSYPIAGTVIDVPSDGSGVYVQTVPVAYSGSDSAVYAASLLASTGGALLGTADALNRFGGAGTTVEASLQKAALATDVCKISYTPGVSTGGFCDVVCAIVDQNGVAISGARQVVIRALSVTGGTGKNVLAAATSAVGTVVSSSGANAAAGPSSLLMTTGSTGLFSFKVTDSSNEALFVWVEGQGCSALVKSITISGN